MLLEIQSDFAYKNAEHSFPMGEDGSYLVDLKGKQQSRRVKFRLMCEHHMKVHEVYFHARRYSALLEPGQKENSHDFHSSAAQC